MCCGRKEPRVCEINPDNCGQSGSSQAGSGRGRKGILDKRNSIFKEKERKKGRENVRCMVLKVVRCCRSEQHGKR